jgi:outer membrane protein OmpA-like peptidoglycan-associated protein
MRNRARGLRTVAAALTLPLMLGGCTVWDEFFGEEPAPQRVEVPAESAEAETPSLGSIPTRRQSSPVAQRQALQQGLAADRSEAEFMEPASPAGETGAEAASQAMAPGDTRSGLPPEPQTRAGFQGQAGTAPQQPGMQQAGARQPQFQQQFRQPTRRELVGVIYFAHGSSNLDNRDRQVLREVKDMLQGTGGQLRVVGHASMRTATLDPARHAMANFEMSQQRAASVANELNRIGVPDSALVVEAFGAQQPVFYEFMPTGEAGNRRAEIYLEY